jgi:hypothetical protein
VAGVVERGKLRENIEADIVSQNNKGASRKLCPFIATVLLCASARRWLMLFVCASKLVI